jgi:hypothetical protein
MYRSVGLLLLLHGASAPPPQEKEKGGGGVPLHCAQVGIIIIGVVSVFSLYNCVYCCDTYCV